MSDVIVSYSVSEAGWSFVFWLAVAYLQFFILQFAADTRSRDVLAQKTTQPSISFFMQSIIQFAALFLWAVAAWSVWLKNIRHSDPIEVIYVLLLGFEILAWGLFWGKYAFQLAWICMAMNTVIAFVVMFYTFSISFVGFLLLPYASWEAAQTVNFYRFAKLHGNVEILASSGRLRESAVRTNANAFFLTATQSPDEHIVETHEVPPSTGPNFRPQSKPSQKSEDDLMLKFDDDDE